MSPPKRRRLTSSKAKAADKAAARKDRFGGSAVPGQFCTYSSQNEFGKLLCEASEEEQETERERGLLSKQSLTHSLSLEEEKREREQKQRATRRHVLFNPSERGRVRAGPSRRPLLWQLPGGPCERRRCFSFGSDGKANAFESRSGRLASSRAQTTRSRRKRRRPELLP